MDRLGCFVVGMHRSGTSFGAGLVRLAGLERLRGDDIGQLESNPHGHEEIKQLIWVNADILASLGSGWAAISIDPPIDVALVPSGLKRRAADWLAARVPDGSWFWKDPRTSLTLPVWREAIVPGSRPCGVLVHRHPVAVASSLARRDGMAEPTGLALWEAYARHALFGLEGLPVAVLDYDEALEEPQRALDGLRTWFEGLDALLQPVAEQEVVESWVDRGARHHERKSLDLGALSGSQLALYEVLRELPHRSERFEVPDLPPPTPWAAAVLDQRRLRTQALRRLEHSRSQRWHRRAGRWTRLSVRRTKRSVRRARRSRRGVELAERPGA